MQAISAHNLGKAYRLYARPLDRVREWLTRRRLHEQFWAVRDVDLEVVAGEAIGVIGENGAGKSTFLGLLTGITRPTIGSVHVRGRIAAILELGAGFHPEFTGRHNAYLHVALFGITGRDADERVEEAIAFSELGHFVDQPVRTYSSGMYVRLAFALAVSIDPDVLIIDEALAVGDQHFQTKCVDRIASFRQQKKTIVFCSHHMYFVKKLCDRAVWLRGGQIAALGSVDEVVDAYLEDVRSREAAAPPSKEAARAAESALIRLVRIALEDAQGNAVETLRTGDALTVRVWVERSAASRIAPGIAIAFVRNDGLVCYCVSTEMDGVGMDVEPDGTFTATLHVPRLPLLGGGYYVNVATTDNANGVLPLDVHERLAPFRVRNVSDEFGIARMEHSWSRPAAGTVRPAGQR